MSSLKTAILLFIISCITITSIPTKVHAVDANSPREVIEKYEKFIVASARKTGVWPSVTAGQMILESNNPFRKLEKEGNNFFGMKWSKRHEERYPGAFPVEYSTKENSNTSHQITTRAKFTHFPKAEDSITEHTIIWWNGMYKEEVKLLEDFNSTVDDFIKEVGNGPYATDAAYYKLLKNIINKNDLERLDKLAFPEGRKFAGFGDRTVGAYTYPNDGYNAEDVTNMGSVEKGSNGNSYVVVKEEDLVGMYPKSFFLDKHNNVDLPSYDSLSTEEKINLKSIKDGIIQNNSWSLWDTLRVFVVFIGLWVLIYAVLFITGYLFDKSNNILEISLINILTVGALQYSDEEYERRGYVNKSRLFKIELALFLVGFFLVSGGMFNFIIDIIWRIQNIFGS